MAQHRDPPAYQEYAAGMMARTDYRVMSLEGRGLFLTLRYECWVNRELPCDPPLLARVLGFPIQQVERALVELRPFFSFDAGVIRCPELDDYRAHLDERYQKQSEGGRAGAAKTNKVRNNPATTRPPGNPRLPRGSLVKQSSIQPNPDQSYQREPLDVNLLNDRERQVDGHNEWLNDYERQSNGR
jgi:hypothetical protein